MDWIWRTSFQDIIVTIVYYWYIKFISPQHFLYQSSRRRVKKGGEKGRRGGAGGEGWRDAIAAELSRSNRDVQGLKLSRCGWAISEAMDISFAFFKFFKVNMKYIITSITITIDLPPTSSSQSVSKYYCKSVYRCNIINPHWIYSLIGW